MFHGRLCNVSKMAAPRDGHREILLSCLLMVTAFVFVNSAVQNTAQVGFKDLNTLMSGTGNHLIFVCEFHPLCRNQNYTKYGGPKPGGRLSAKTFDTGPLWQNSYISSREFEKNGLEEGGFRNHARISRLPPPPKF